MVKTITIFVTSGVSIISHRKEIGKTSPINKVKTRRIER